MKKSSIKDNVYLLLHSGEAPKYVRVLRIIRVASEMLEQRDGCVTFYHYESCSPLTIIYTEKFALFYLNCLVWKIIIKKSK